MTTPRTVTSADELLEGDLIEAVKGEFRVTGRVKFGFDGNPHMRDMGFALRYRMSAGWQVTLLERPIPEPPVGLYVYANQVNPDGTIRPGAMVCKRKLARWTDADGTLLEGWKLESIESAWAEGKLVALTAVPPQSIAPAEELLPVF